jgi:triosephosphate isomerase
MKKNGKDMKKLIVANWKMNPTDGKTAMSWFKKIQTAAHAYGTTVETVVCPPAVYLESLQSVVTNRSCVLGAQDCFWEVSGKHTGQISPEMIFNAKARYVIIGHSEQRALGETNETINKKIKTILQYPLSVILCIGEKERSTTGKQFKEIKKQINECLQGVPVKFFDRIVITYEPTWAISTGSFHSASPEICFEMSTAIRRSVAELTGNQLLAQNMRMLYGGSANPENTRDFLTTGGVQGLLVGQASLDPKAFGTMVKIANKL